MGKKILIILDSLIFVLGISKLSFAMMCHSQNQGHQRISQTETQQKQETIDVPTQAIPKETVNIGNKICPVSGEKIEEEMKATYEYEGKIYNFCCAYCIEEFKKDPEKYIKKIEEEKQKEKAEEKVEQPSITHMHEEQGHMHH